MAVTYTLGVTFNFVLSWVRRTTGNDGVNVTDNPNSAYSYVKSLGSGTGADQADRIWHDERTVTAGANDDLDLTSLAQEIFAQSVPLAMVNIKYIVIYCLSTTTGDKLKLDTTVANGYQSLTDGSGAKILVGPDSPLVLGNKKDGFGAVTSTNKVLRITNPGAKDVTYQVAIIGTSA